MAHTAPGGWRSLKPIFLDFEASGVTGWPIEVGLASIVDGRVLHEEHRIRPEPDWDEAEWDEVAEMVHGIPLTNLRCCGRPAHEVAERVLAVITGRTLVSDAASYDTAFLRRLLEVREGSSDCRVIDLAALAAQMEGEAHARLQAELGQRCVQHGAGWDAARLAYAWLAARGEQAKPGHVHPCGTWKRSRL